MSREGETMRNGKEKTEAQSIRLPPFRPRDSMTLSLSLSFSFCTLDSFLFHPIKTSESTNGNHLGMKR